MFFMDLKRIIVYGALGWVLIFFEVSILLFGLKLTPGLLYYIVHYILLIMIVAIVALLYFNGKVKKGFTEGILAGILFLLTGIVLDSLITIPLFMQFDYSFFIDIYLWIGFFISVLTTGIIGLIKK
jgi:hypothetical protein